MLGDWHGWVALEAPGADPELAALAISERLPDARVRTAPLPEPAAALPELDLGRARARSGLAVLAQAVGAHPLEVAIALAAHGQSLEIAADDPDMIRNVRNWGLSRDPLPDAPDEDDRALGIDDDPWPGRGTPGACCSNCWHGQGRHQLPHGRRPSVPGRVGRPAPRGHGGGEALYPRRAAG